MRKAVACDDDFTANGDISDGVITTGHIIIKLNGTFRVRNGKWRTSIAPRERSACTRRSRSHDKHAGIEWTLNVAAKALAALSAKARLWREKVLLSCLFALEWWPKFVSVAVGALEIYSLRGGASSYIVNEIFKFCLWSPIFLHLCLFYEDVVQLYH